MDKYSEEIVRWIQLYLLGNITPQERQKLEDWCNQREANRLFFDRICQDQNLAEEIFIYEKVDEDKALKNFEHGILRKNAASRLDKSKVDFLRIGKYAAVIILVLGFGFIWQLKRQVPETGPGSETAVSIVPGSNKAVLVLNNGKRIALHDHIQEEIPVEDTVKAFHHQGSLIYSASPAETAQEEVYNTLEVPRGGEYKLILADGTKVHLNSATSIKYPVAFTGNERKVYLSGEAYFEVAKDAGHPFLVETQSTEIKVYGTSFNVNTFEKVNTVLVEGSVGLKLLKTGEEIRIKPGQLAVSDESKGIRVSEVNTGLYTAWKDGLFRFENRRLEDIMNILSNWYDVEICYQYPEVKELHFSGYMERYKEINIILEAIHEAIGVEFQVSGKTITISE